MSDLDKKLNSITKELEESRDEVILTNEQKRGILEAWKSAPKDEPPSLKELTNIAFPYRDLDGRSLEGKAVRDFLANFNVSPPTNAHVKIGPYELSVSEKEFIQNNIDRKPLEICRILWPTVTNMSPLSKEFKATNAFINSLNTKQVNYNLEQDVKDIFTPPKNYSECLKLVNKFNHDILSISDISEKQRQGIFTLIRYLHSPRFLKTISTFRDEENRTLFLSEFIRATYDKPDLSVDELNLYVSLAASYPLEQIALAEREALSFKMQEEMESEKGRISEATVKAIETKNKEYQECQIRQEKLIQSLNGSRSKRLEKHMAANSSVLSLIEYWKEEKKRQRLIALADLKKKVLKSSVDELITFDDIKAEIFGAIKLFDTE